MADHAFPSVLPLWNPGLTWMHGSDSRLRAGTGAGLRHGCQADSSTAARYFTLKNAISRKLLKITWRRERDSDPLRVLKAWRLLILRSA